MKARIELLELLAEAEEDVNAGRVAPMEDTFANLRAILKEKRNGYIYRNRNGYSRCSYS